MGSCDSHMLTIPGCKGRDSCLRSSGPAHWLACPACAQILLGQWRTPLWCVSPRHLHSVWSVFYPGSNTASTYKFTQGILDEHGAPLFSCFEQTPRSIGQHCSDVAVFSWSQLVTTWGHSCLDGINVRSNWTCVVRAMNKSFRIQSRKNSTFDVCWWFQICQHNESLYEYVMGVFHQWLTVS